MRKGVTIFGDHISDVDIPWFGSIGSCFLGSREFWKNLAIRPI